MNNEPPSKKPLKLPESKRIFICTSCKKDADHVLTPTNQGAAYVCQTCQNPTRSYTHKEMAEIVMRKVFKLPDQPAEVQVPEGIRVFLEHHGEELGEMEADGLSVKYHIELTGQLPIVGKPLYAPVAGQRAFALPYGKVTRLEIPKD